MVCPNCKRSYNLEFKPPRVAGICDVCGHELKSRSDDDEATIRRRLEVYHSETKPLVLYFWERGLLRDIDSEAAEEVVADRTVQAIADLDGGVRMIIYKSPKEIDKMRKAGRVVAGTIDRVVAAVRPGITTAELDAIAEAYIRERGATPSFKGYGGSANRAAVPGRRSARR